MKDQPQSRYDEQDREDLGVLASYFDSRADDMGGLRLSQEERRLIASVLRSAVSEKAPRYRDAPDGRPFGAALATAVLQSNEYHHLDDLARGECDEILEHWKTWLKEGK